MAISNWNNLYLHFYPKTKVVRTKVFNVPSLLIFLTTKDLSNTTPKNSTLILN